MDKLKFFTEAGIKVFSKEDILENMLAIYKSVGLDVKRNSAAMVSSQINSGLIADFLASANNLFMSRSPYSANGFHLDNVAADKQLVRKSRQKSFVSVEITFTDTIIKAVPRGEIRLMHPYNVFFENADFNKTAELTQTVAFIAEDAGTAGNVPILDNSELSVIKGGGNIDTAMQVSIGNNGTEDESDSELRQRYYNEKIKPFSITNLEEGIIGIEGIVNARLFFNRSTEWVQDVAPNECGVAITTKGTYDDDPAVDWTEALKQELWAFMRDNFPPNMITNSKNAIEFRYKNKTNFISYYVKAMRYVTTSSVKIYLIGTFPKPDIFNEPIVQAEMTKIGNIVLDYAKGNITDELTAVKAMEIVTDKLNNDIFYKNLQSFVRNIEIGFALSEDSELGGEIALGQNKTIETTNVFTAVTTYEKQEIPHIEVIINNVQ